MPGTKGRLMTMMNTQKMMDFNKVQLRRRRVRRVDMFFDTLTRTFAVLSAIILMWVLISWVDFCAHDLSRSYDFWLGNLNLIEIICGK